MSRDYRQNPFLKFVNEKKRERKEWKGKSIQELVKLCGPLWDRLSAYQKGKYSGGKYDFPA